MNNSKTLPLVFLLTVGSLTTATLALGQTAPDATGDIATEEQVVQADFRGPRDGSHERHRPHGDRGGMMFGAMMDRVDANADGAVSQDEIDLFRASLVAGADASGDGAIDLDEFEAIFLELAHHRMVDQFQDLDADGDGAVTQAEMDARFGGVVADMDRNGDGILDADDRGGRGRDGGRDRNERVNRG